MSTLDAFTGGGYQVTVNAPRVRRRVPGTTRWSVWTGTGWTDDAATTPPPATVTAPSAITRRWVEPEIAAEAPRTAAVARGVVGRTVRPYDPDRLDMFCRHGHVGLWRLRTDGVTHDCAGCKVDQGRRYRERKAAEAAG